MTEDLFANMNKQHESLQKLAELAASAMAGASLSGTISLIRFKQ